MERSCSWLVLPRSEEATHRSGLRKIEARRRRHGANPSWISSAAFSGEELTAATKLHAAILAVVHVAEEDHGEAPIGPRPATPLATHVQIGVGEDQLHRWGVGPCAVKTTTVD